MRSLQRALTVLVASTAILAATATAVQADSSQLDNPLVNDETGGHYALYNGEWIDMSQGWQGAQICVEQLDTSMICYDDEADYRSGEGLPAADGAELFAKSDCRSGYVCLWDNRQYASTRIEYSTTGEKDLSEHGFRDRPNSVVNNRSIDVRLGDYDEVHNGSCDCSWWVFSKSSVSDLGTHDDFRDDGRNWNNKVDEVELR